MVCMIYRDATVWDATEITRLWGLMHLEIDKRPSVRKEYADLKTFFINLIVRIEHPDWIVLVAEEEKRIIGFIMGVVHWPEYNHCHKVGTCEALYVEQDYRHNGIHDILIAKIIEKGNERKVFEYEFIGTYEPTLIKFWDKLGFEPVQIIYRQKEGYHGRRNE